ncbi:uncharacterized protein LOC118201551 [Stegodyphus dumicola]|uniref:uncharacterized protein LOC118201551 n=1 Tax=Stegodyphus dumicola TaxID=202533 RepID=UPI0015AAE612|nr:uncharacterized protein LOC118201551 [Stegodyphus dumicola]
MANRLSNEELRKSLQDYGEDVGPITPTTRSVWEKKLLALRKTNVPATMTRGLNAFSSDDSEIEGVVSGSIRVRKKRTFNRNESVVRPERMSLIRPREMKSSPETDVFKKPSPVHIIIPGQDRKAHYDSPLHRNQNTKSKTRKSFGKQTSFDVETSDSDFDTESPYMPGKSARLRKKTPPNISSDYRGMNLRKLNEDGTKYENSVTRKSLNSHWTSDTQHSLHHFSTTLNRLKREHIDPGYRTNGYLPNTISNGEFHEEKVQGSSTNYSHCVSWLLVVGVVAFFVLIGALYMTEVQKTTQTANKSHSKFCSEVPEEQCKLLILISQELHHLLTTVAGNI